jgi:hypothetical protein
MNARHLIAAALVGVGIIHLIPIIGVLGGPRLAQLYGFAVDDPNLAIVLRHRALLFGLLGSLCVWAAFRPALQPLALGAASISVVGFLALALATGGYNQAIARVVTADWVAAGLLFIGWCGIAWGARNGE